MSARQPISGKASVSSLVRATMLRCALRRAYLHNAAVNVWFGQIGDLEVEGETFVGDWKQNVIDLTVGLTFH